MIVEIIIIACFCNGLYLAAEEGMIFFFIAKWIKKAPAWFNKPIIGCVYCMASFWGTLIHLAHDIINPGTLIHFLVTLPIVIIAGVFTNGLLRSIYDKLQFYD